MRNFNKCDVCRDWHWTDEKCKPIYLVYHEEYMGDEPKAIRADSHEDASIEYGKYYNNDDFPLMTGETIKVKVEREGIIKFFEVGAVPRIHYTSDEIEGIDGN